MQLKLFCYIYLTFEHIISYIYIILDGCLNEKIKIIFDILIMLCLIYNLIYRKRIDMVTKKSKTNKTEKTTVVQNKPAKKKRITIKEEIKDYLAERNNKVFIGN